jgi:hypothetical protein
MVDELIAALASLLTGCVLAATIVLLLGRRVSLTIATTIAVLAATLLAAVIRAVMGGGASPQLIVVAACAFILAALGFTSIARSARLVMLAVTILGVALVAVGVRLPVTGHALPDSLITLVMLAPLVLMCTNIEGSPGGQVAVTPVMVIGASIVGLIRGDHGLAVWGLAAGGSCLGIAGWIWLGRGIRLHPAASLFLAMTVISLGVGFEGKAGLSVLAIGIGLLVIPVTELFVLLEGRRRAGNLYWGQGEDHLWFRLTAQGLPGKVAAAIMIGAAAFGVTCSCLTAGDVIPWPVGLVLAWTMKLALTWFALRGDPAKNKIVIEVA